MYDVAGSSAKQVSLMHDFTSESDMLPPPLEGLVNQDVPSKPLISKSGRSVLGPVQALFGVPHIHRQQPNSWPRATLKAELV